MTAKRRSKGKSGKLRPRRRFSQNFLVDEVVASLIVESLDCGEGDLVFEIGSGKGFLTEFIVDRGAQVIAVEKDRRMVGMLKKKFPQGSGVMIRHADVLNMPEEYWPEEQAILAGNLPYAISHQLIFWILHSQEHWRHAVIMLQREVALRLCAEGGEAGRSAMSVRAQMLCRPTYLFEVKPSSFYPRPKVTSAVVRLDFPSAYADIETTPLFEYIVDAAFAHKRKILANNLREIPNVTTEEVETVLREAGVERTQRAEQLSVYDFVNLTTAAARVWRDRWTSLPDRSHHSRRRR